MRRIDEILEIRQTDPPPPASIPPDTRLSTRIVGYQCDRCSDFGFVRIQYRDQNGKIVTTHPNHNNLVECDCRKAINAELYRQQQNQELIDMDGLTPVERHQRFSDLTPVGGISLVIQEIVKSVPRHRGFMTLYGPPGTGKSAVMISAVNMARESGISAAYRRLSDLFDELRDQYDQEAAFQRRWDTLTSAKVLAIDEIDKWNQTAWAQERFDSLLDHRFRASDTRLTLLAANRLDGLSAHNRSRIFDAAFSQRFELDGLDIRQEER